MIELSPGRKEHIGPCTFRHSGGPQRCKQRAHSSAELISCFSVITLGKLGMEGGEMTAGDAAAVTGLSDNIYGSGPKALTSVGGGGGHFASVFDSGRAPQLLIKKNK